MPVEGKFTVCDLDFTSRFNSSAYVNNVSVIQGNGYCNLLLTIHYANNDSNLVYD